MTNQKFREVKGSNQEMKSKWPCFGGNYVECGRRKFNVYIYVDCTYSRVGGGNRCCPCVAVWSSSDSY